MSETDVGASSTAQEGVLYDQAGNRIGDGRRLEPRDEPLVRFAREQPVTLAVIALGIGYLIGKVL
jgi:hypothetical protein